MEQHLYLLWTTQDKLNAQFMVLQYASAGLLQDWWDKVTVIIWGAAAKLLAEDEDIRQRVRMAQHAGVKFSACAASARQLGVRQVLEEMQIETKGWGLELSQLIQQGGHLLSI